MIGKTYTITLPLKRLILRDNILDHITIAETIITNFMYLVDDKGLESEHCRLQKLQRSLSERASSFHASQLSNKLVIKYRDS